MVRKRGDEKVSATTWLGEEVLTNLFSDYHFGKGGDRKEVEK
jgi:hypothetical protein